MKLTVKTLKGSKFEVECESSSTVLEVKGIIVSYIIPAAKCIIITIETSVLLNFIGDVRSRSIV